MEAIKDCAFIYSAGPLRCVESDAEKNDKSDRENHHARTNCKMKTNAEPKADVTTREWSDDDDCEIDDPEDEAALNCGKTRDGACLEAGSEYCEFDCPYHK